MTFMNYFTKVWAIYLIIVEYDTFSQNSLLLFSYVLYAFLEVVAMAAALSIVLLAKVARFIFSLPVFRDNLSCSPTSSIKWDACLFCIPSSDFASS